MAPQHRRCASTVYSAVGLELVKSLRACGLTNFLVCVLWSVLVVLGFFCNIFYWKSLHCWWCFSFGVFASCAVWSLVCCCCYFLGSSDCVGKIRGERSEQRSLLFCWSCGRRSRNGAAWVWWKRTGHRVDTFRCPPLWEISLGLENPFWLALLKSPCSLMLRAVEPRENVEHLIRVQWTVIMKQPFLSCLCVVVVSGFSPRNELE